MTVNSNTAQTVKRGNNIIEEVEDFKYLGSMLSNTNGTAKDIKARISKGEKRILPTAIHMEKWVDQYEHQTGDIQRPNMEMEIKRRRWRWIGHVLRKGGDDVTKIALRWTPDGKRKRGHPKETWRRMVEQEMKDIGKIWGEIKKKAKHRQLWRQLVEALCADKHEKDK
ncbi:uncharacterized protein LOC125678421 [Ostrea edulis]|uniref:uncharacterized protein LOC125678421 n=1 Tax=Ostrea edulis TaxID=37623 RepID=UPI002094EA23|nr:uncharacterized protein LOC125678421 [Ostrea edulis]